jgi:hypothetical protein
MSEINTGGSAFPVHGLPGMTLRDYFASKAMQVGFSAILRDRRDSEPKEAIQICVKSAYQMADAMLKAREA